MRGHEPIIAMRKAGRKPAIVFINDFDCPADWPEWEGDHATVCVAGDTPEALDLRFVLGLSVSITGATENRAKRLMQACKDAGATTVAAGAPSSGNGYYVPGWSDIWRKESEAVHG